MGTHLGFFSLKYNALSNRVDWTSRRVFCQNVSLVALCTLENSHKAFLFYLLVQCVVRKLSLYLVQYSYLSRKLTSFLSGEGVSE